MKKHLKKRCVGLEANYSYALLAALHNPTTVAASLIHFQHDCFKLPFCFLTTPNLIPFSARQLLLHGCCVL
jgi:hypothetical protein